LVQLDIPRDQVDVIEAHRSELSCVDLIPTPHRNYRVGPSLGHVIGYMSEVTPEELEDKPDDFRRGQTIGRRGLERRWERELSGHPLKPMRNRVMRDTSPAGSTCKVVTSPGVLEEGEITPTATLFCNGGYTMGNHRWRCDKQQGHGLLTLHSALKMSCDAFY